MDEPNPATAPITSDKKATMKNNISSNMIQDFSKIRIALILVTLPIKVLLRICNYCLLNLLETGAID